MDQIQMASKMAGDWWAEKLHEDHADKKAPFSVAVARHCEAEMRRRGNHAVCLEVDYDPAGPLLDAVREIIDPTCAGVMFSARGILPQKHSLVVRLYQLDPKEGYGMWGAPIPVPVVAL